MSFCGSYVENVSSGRTVDLLGGASAPGTPIIIFGLNLPPGTANQQWRMIPVPECGPPSGVPNIFTIQSVLTGMYASIGGVAVSGNGVVSAALATLWEVNVIDNIKDIVTINVPHTNLFWNVTSSNDGTQITLANGDGSTNQHWITHTAVV